MLEKSALVINCVIFLALAILFGTCFVVLAGTTYSEDRYTEQICTFSECDYVVHERGGARGTEYYDVYVQEYEKPLQIDQIVFDQVNKSVLFDLKEGDQITVLLDQKNHVISMAHDGQYVLTYEDYVAEHESNNTVGVFATLILCGMCLGLVIFLIFRYKKTGRVLDVLPKRF